MVPGAHPVDVGAAVEEGLGGGAPAVAHGHQQRGQPAVVSDQVCVGKRLGHRPVAVARQRRRRLVRVQEGAGRGLGLGLGRAPAAAPALQLLERRDPLVAAALRLPVLIVTRRDVDDAGGDRGIRPAVHEGVDGPGAVGRRREHEGRLAPRGFHRVRVGAVLDQLRHGVTVSGGGGEVQRGGAPGGGGRARVRSGV